MPLLHLETLHVCDALTSHAARTLPLALAVSSGVSAPGCTCFSSSIRLLRHFVSPSVRSRVQLLGGGFGLYHFDPSLYLTRRTAQYGIVVPRCWIPAFAAALDRQYLNISPPAFLDAAPLHECPSESIRFAHPARSSSRSKRIRQRPRLRPSKVASECRLHIILTSM
jgi:hypothetical protein